MTARIRVTRDLAEKGVDDAIASATKTGADEMRRIIETSATPAKKAGAWTSNWFSATTEGRVDTGRMLGDVSEVRTKRSGKWGWALNGGTADMYYLYQENGFWHVGAKRDVPPMHALLGSFIKAREQLIRDLDKLVK